jgi:hypothetical protein
MKGTIHRFGFGERVMPAPEWFRQHRENRVTELRERVWRAVKPVVREDTRLNRADPEGSCVLLKIGKQRFFLSAAHVFKFAKTEYLYVPAGDSRLVPLIGGSFMRTSANLMEATEDELDVAIHSFPEGTYPDLEPDFLSLDDIDCNHVSAAKEPYVAIGFPAETVRYTEGKRHASVGAITWTATARPSELVATGLSQFSHIGIQFDRQGGVVTGGESAAVPEPDGMSGGALFHFESVKPNANAKDDKLVGILIERSGTHKLMIATHIAFCLEIIRHYHRELSHEIPPTTVEVGIKPRFRNASLESD